MGLAARDSRRVYLRDAAIEGADPATFRLVGRDSVAKDARHVYVHGKICDGADVASFVHVGGSWFRDARRVYHHGVPVAGVDVASFRLVPPDAAEDRFGRLRGGVRV